MTADVTRDPPRGLVPTLSLLGPGLVLTGGVVGSGELINAPIQAARFGFVLLWAVFISCVIKYFLQIELARHCLVHNRSALEALNQIPGPKLRQASWIIWAFMLVWTVVQIGSAGILGAIAGLCVTDIAIVPWVAVLAVAVVMLLLWKSDYNRIETVVISLVFGFSLSVLIAMFLLQRTDYRITSTDIAHGLSFSLGENPRMAAYAVVALMGGLGVSGIEVVLYPYWVREKGYADYLGSPQSDGWTARALGWTRVLKVDAAVATIVTTLITAAYFSLGAAVLFEREIIPQGIAVVDQISAIFTDTYGASSRGLFVFGAFCTLFSTLVTATALNGRLYTDFLCVIGIIDRSQDATIQRSHKIVQTLFLVSVLTLFLLMPERPARLVILSQYLIGLLGTPLTIIGVCWLAFQTDPRVRMGRLGAVLLLLTSAIIVACLSIGHMVN